MRAHKLIEILNTRDPGDERGKNFLGYLSLAIKHAAKFFFQVDGLPKFGRLDWQNLPFPLVYFELERDEAYWKEVYVLVARQNEKDGEIRCYLLQTAEDNKKEVHPQNICTSIIKHDEVGYKLSTGGMTNAQSSWTKGEYKEKAEEMAAHLLALLQLINCLNVDSRINQPSVALNKKRIKGGKLPLFEYRTLTIRHSTPGKRSVEIEGDRNSPRLHLRRGHIRRHTTAGNIWVRPCAVGSEEKGTIEKDYRVVA